MLKNAYQEICQTLFRTTGLAAAAEPFIRRLFPWYKAGFYAARIMMIKPGAGCLRLRLQVSRLFPAFVPGQHLQLRVNIRGVDTERTFSICSSSQMFRQQRQLELMIQIQQGGHFTQALSGLLRPGAYVHLTRPEGEFALQQDVASCLIAAGTGVTPLFSMLSSVSRLTKPMVFIYCFRGTDRQLFAEEWAGLKTRFPLLKLVLWDSRERGRLTPEAILEYIQPDAQRRYYLCGPQDFTTQMGMFLQDSGIRPSHINSESFGGWVSGSDISHPVLLQQGRQRHQLRGQGSLLQRAEQAGLTLPYGCRRGVCMQCLCEKRSGIVRNLLTGELSDAGPGRIQLCISEAVSPVEIHRVELSV